MKQEDRNAAQLIAQYRLLAKSSEAVYEEYRNRPVRARWNNTEEIDQFSDRILWDKGDPLIQLAIAQHGTNTEIGSEIMAGDNAMLRLAFLGNWCFKNVFSEINAYAFLGGRDKLVDFLGRATNDELTQLVKNHSIPRNFLVQLFDSNDLWVVLNEEQQKLVAYEITKNPSVFLPYDETDIDGWADYSYHKLFYRLWDLCSIRRNPDWAYVLWELTNKLVEAYQFYKGTPEERQTLFALWADNPDDANEYSHHRGMTTEGHLRKNIATASYASSSEFKDHPDFALRYAYYSSNYLTTEQMQESVEKERNSFYAMLENRRLMLSQASRETLSDLACQYPNDEDGYRDAPDAFRSSVAYYEKKHPLLFAIQADESEEVDEDGLPINNRKFELSREADYQHHSEVINSLKQFDINATNRLYGHIVLTVVMVLALYIAKQY